MNQLALVLAGILLCNGIPHLTSGLSGAAFPTPFAKPSGVGDSPALLNFLWGAFNLLLGVYVLSRHAPLVGFNTDFGALVGGGLLSGVFLSWHFAKVRRDRLTKGAD